MKNELNRNIIGIKNIREEDLFGEMANQFNNNMIAKCTYVKEVHKMIVNFRSDFEGGNKQKELGDLLLLTFDKAKNELRLCILQAKYRRGLYRYFLDCKADIYQWELLYYKPNVTNSSSLNFPSNILNFSHDYKSITAYGVFYHDYINNDIDFYIHCQIFLLLKNYHFFIRKRIYHHVLLYIHVLK